MANKLLGMCCIMLTHLRIPRAATAGAVLAALATTVSAQEVRVSGTVTSQGGAPVQGAIVRVQGADSAVAITSAAGRYSIKAPANGTLLITAIGYRRAEVPVNGRTAVDVVMERVTMLDQVVVTGYTEGQRRSEITGAVGSVNVEAASRQTTASVAQRLDATGSGVTVAASGSPGARSTVRIRGIS